MAAESAATHVISGRTLGSRDRDCSAVAVVVRVDVILGGIGECASNSGDG